MERENRIKGIDAVRGIAAIIIVIFHYPQHFRNYLKVVPFSKSLGIIYSNGLYMVEIFFSISGFVIFYNYFHELSDNNITMFEFLRKKITKLYPLYFFTTFLVAIEQLIVFLTHHLVICHETNNFVNFIYAIFLMNNGILTADIGFNGPAWTISSEFLCYILFAALTKINGNGNKWKFGVLVLFMVWAAEFTIPAMNLIVFNSLTARGIKSFFIGVLIGMVYEQFTNIKYKNYFAAAFLCLGINTFTAIIRGNSNVLSGGG